MTPKSEIISREVGARWSCIVKSAIKTKQNLYPDRYGYKIRSGFEIIVVVHTTKTVHRPEIMAVRASIAGDRIARKPDSSNGWLVKICLKG